MASQPQSVRIQYNLHQLTDSIYVYHADARLGRCFVGIIISPEGTILVDSGNGTLHGNEIKRAIQGINAPPVTHIVLTHHHWDHVFGSCVFPSARVIAHEMTHYHLNIMAQEPWSEAYVLQKDADKPWGSALAKMMTDAIPDWTEFRAVPAHETFEDKFELSLGDVQIEVHHVGGEHEPDSCVVLARPGNVLFLGDATYGRGKREDWNLQALLQAHETFLTYPADYFVEGHRLPVPRPRFEKRVNRLREQVASQDNLRKSE